MGKQMMLVVPTTRFRERIVSEGSLVLGILERNVLLHSFDCSRGRHITGMANSKVKVINEKILQIGG